MSIVRPPPSIIVILLDPSNRHFNLDEEGYYIFYRFTTFDKVCDLISTRQFGRIDLHVQTDFNFDLMRPYPRVYIHTYFVDNEESSLNNEIERQKIRDTIRTCCEINGEEFITRGILEANDRAYDEVIDLAEQLLQMDIDRMNRLPQ